MPAAGFLIITWAQGLLQAVIGDLRINVILYFLVTLPLLAALTVSCFSFVVRRLHDPGYTGWLSLLILVPLVNLAGCLLLLLLPGQPQTNQYGPPP